MKVLVQNLQKRPDLPHTLLDKYNPDVALFQEISLNSEPTKIANSGDYNVASFTSKRGYGTAIYSLSPLSNIHKVLSPNSEFGGFIVKKTIIATLQSKPNDIRCVSFHGYNGQPFCNAQKLVAHVDAVLQALQEEEATPTIFAGDFNTWTDDHLQQVSDRMAKDGYQPAYSWPYPGRPGLTPLDHVFVRGVQVDHCENYPSDSDHLGAVLEISLSK